ncbi:hypothetical protein BH11BAC2_BH11BAC2_13460 [soil metagenome]
MLCTYCSEAYHIAGGDLSTRWLGGNLFEIHLTLYRDCSNPQAAPFDPTIIIAVYQKDNDQYVDSVHLDLGTQTTLALTGAACVPPPSVCMQQGDYYTTINLPDHAQGYYLIWERCCRNNTIINIITPDQVGMAFYEEIPDPALQSSSPVFNSPPAPFICEGQFFRFKFDASDVDGDSLVYALTNPLNGGNTSQQSPNPFSFGGNGSNQIPLPGPYSPVIWESGYGVNNICGSDIPFTINSSTGEIEGIPDIAGIYALAVTIYEYRNGIYLGLVRREIEFTVIACTSNSIPQLSPNVKNKNYEIYATDTLCFDVTATDPNGDSLFMIHYGEVFPNLPQTTIQAPFAYGSDTSDIANVTTYFCWKTDCNQSRDSAYKIVYEIRDNGCPLPATTFGKFNIRVLPTPLVPKQNLLCIDLISDSILKVIKAPDPNLKLNYFSYFTLYRSLNGGPFIAILAFEDGLNNEFIDSTAFDNNTNNYCYALAGTNVCGVEGLFSDTTCSIPAINSKRNYIKSVSVEKKNEIKIIWEDFIDGPYSTYYVYRKSNQPQSTYQQIAELPNYIPYEWTDNSVSTSEYSYCYQIVNKDFCENESPESDEACSILLNGNAGNFENNLHWNPYVFWRGDIDKYSIERSLINIGTPYRESLVNAGIDTNAIDQDLDLAGGIFSYRVRAFEGPGSYDAQSLSNEIELAQPPILFLPNAFTPNGDGANDGWGASSGFVKTMVLYLYNRWGQLIFTANNESDRWDGTLKGKDQQEGVYFYKVKFTGYDSDDIREKTGAVTLIR